MELLIVGCLAFVGTHLGISGTPLRGALLRLLGQKGYLVAYSLVAIGAFAVMIYGYGQARPAAFVWSLPVDGAQRVTKGLALVATLLVVMGNLVRNPTTAMMEGAVKEAIPGLLKITRHPVQWGLLLFAIGHLVSNGDGASIWLFGSLATVSFFGALSIDARRRKEADPHWQAFMAGTSMLPFRALIQGRARLSLSEINWLAFAIGLGVYAALYWLHGPISGGVSLLAP